MSHGVGSLSADEKHELMRRRMLRAPSQTESSSVLSHLYSGVKGLGVGIFGGLTAIPSTTYNAARRDGLFAVNFCFTIKIKKYFLRV